MGGQPWPAEYLSWTSLRGPGVEVMGAGAISPEGAQANGWYQRRFHGGGRLSSLRPQFYYEKPDRSYIRRRKIRGGPRRYIWQIVLPECKCQKCDGSGQVPGMLSGNDCPKCDGRGQLKGLDTPESDSKCS